VEMKVKPMPGTVWCNKQINPTINLFVEGLGNVVVSGATDGGLVLPFTDTRGDVNVKTSMYVVDAVGTDETWRVGKRDYKTTFAEQGVTPGVIIATRAGAGLDQRREADFINVRYNEIAAIGNTEDDGPPMYPAPGFVLCEVLLNKHSGELEVDALHADVLEQPQAVRMVVLATPRGSFPTGVKPGDVVYMPRFTATDFVEFEDGKYRCVHEDDLIGVEDNA
jgi:hypothetical protein